MSQNKPNDKKHIVVLGAGYGGILTAKKLAKKFKKNQDVSITLIDKHSYHTMLTELHEVAAGRVPEDAIRIDLDKVFSGRKVDIVLDEIKNIDFDKKELIGEVGHYVYDYLVLGTGSKPTFYGCKGAQEHALTLWSYEDALKIKYRVLQAFGQASVEKSPEKRSHLLTFVVIGCGFTGIEMIGELAEWSEHLCHDFNINQDEVKFYVMDLLPRVLPMFKEKLIVKTEKRLKKLGVEVLTHSNITEVKKDGVCIEGKEEIPTYTTIWAAGVEGSDLMTQIDGRVIQKAARNRVQTDAYLRAQNKEDVFVVGDNIFYIPEGEERPVPQMVENAEHSSALVAKNIAATIYKKPLKTYQPAFHGAMVCIGGRYGVAQVGTPKTQFVLSGFLAMFVKHFINLIYFIQVAGFNKVWQYMMHEFFHVEDKRSFVGGHFSKRSPNFWLVPLRLFVGLKWMLEGLEKLPKIMKDPNDIFLIPSKVPVSGATEWVEEVATEAIVWTTTLPVPDFIENIISWMLNLKGAYALPVPGFITTLVESSMDLMFYQASGEFTVLASVFQTIMVLGEIAVGGALIIGLFTALASVGSIVMGVMIWTSGMAPVEMLWYLAGAVALIGGSGSTFGLDYYVLPFLKKKWKKLKFVKKWYLFT
jgi:NADH:ubiquinone reductase (H+-translocating)